MKARIPNLELLLYKAQQALAHDPDFVQKIAEIKENESRKKVYLDFSVECFSQIWILTLPYGSLLKEGVSNEQS